MKAGARLTVAVMVAALVGLLLGSALLGAESPEVDEPGRYQMANFSSIGVSVLDTHRRGVQLQVRGRGQGALARARAISSSVAAPRD
jgi:hypothetical protein